MAETILITGASSGIGKALALRCAQAGHDLVLLARTKSKLTELAEQIVNEFGVKALVVIADLSATGSAATVAAHLQKHQIQIDMLINNAGFGDYKEFLDMDYAKINKMVQLNISSLTELSRLFLPSMVQRGKGRIMNVASVAAFQAGPYFSVYAATKAYVLSFSEGLAYELERSPVTVTALCPGLTDTNFIEAADMTDSPMVKSLKRGMSAKKVADMGYKAMMKGKTVRVCGLTNHLLLFMERFVSRGLVTKLTGMMLDK